MIVVFNDHILNLANTIEVKWHSETSEMVYQNKIGDWFGIKGTKKEYDELLKSIKEKINEK